MSKGLPVSERTGSSGHTLFVNPDPKWADH